MQEKNIIAGKRLKPFEEITNTYECDEDVEWRYESP